MGSSVIVWVGRRLVRHWLLNQSLFLRCLGGLEFLLCSLWFAFSTLHWFRLDCFFSARLILSSRRLRLSFFSRFINGAIAKTVKPRSTFLNKFVNAFPSNILSLLNFDISSIAIIDIWCLWSSHTYSDFRLSIFAIFFYSTWIDRYQILIFSK